MSKRRQDSWTSEEDLFLAETVLRYIRKNKTQLEAFKEAGKKLSRTAAACGFRWNATLRKQYVEAIEIAKGKQHNQPIVNSRKNRQFKGAQPLEQVISLLKELKSESDRQHLLQQERQELNQLRAENELLTERLGYYEEAFREIYNIWKWMENKNEHYK